ncbi:HAD-like domain-containing protein [Naematelia encephala]|uniref:HAD-like domain-containing protein n=1 Tax=Naematelia encephala TaxID=71784 RepID=A0A1Y2BGP4_9TREE|nr:HAD-like domain-containing protein [Naematelia encephala]
MPAEARPKVEYAIFDLDGLLGDSESILSYTTNTILSRYGHRMTWEIKSGLMGKTQRPATEYLFSHFPDLEGKLTIDEFLKERNEMQEALFRKVSPMKGAVSLVTGLYQAGVPIALATGSNNYNLALKTSHLPDMFKCFPPTRILTADSPEVAPGRGKPLPDIFLAAARSLGRDVGTADECTPEQAAERRKGIVFEDAVPGVNAGVAAGMNVIWVPDPELRALAPDNDYGAAQILNSLDEFKSEEWGLAPIHFEKV